MKKVFWIVLLLSVIARVPVWLNYQPLYGNDTHGYEELAHMIGALDFSGYDAVRTPGYPLFMLLLGFNGWLIWGVQSILGIGTVLMVFWLTAKCTGKPGIAGVAGATVGLAIHHVFFETILQTEALSSFLVVLAAVLLWRVICGPAMRPGLCAILGFVAALAALTRPLFVYLGPLFLVVLAVAWISSGVRWRAMCVGATSLILPVVLLVGGWMLFNKCTVNTFALTTTIGFNLTSHSGAFIEKADDEYATIRDIYLKYRKEMEGWMQQTDDNRPFLTGTAVREIRAVTGWETPELSARLKAMSLDLFRRYPGLYLKRVAKAWTRFWRVPFSRYPELARNMMVDRCIETAWWPVKLCWLALEVGFFLALPVLLIRCVRNWPSPVYLFLGTLWLVVVLASVAQALVEYGDNARYAVPLQPLIAVVVFSTWGRLKVERHERRMKD